MAVVARLSLKENRPDFAGFGNGLEGGAIEGFIGFKGISEDFKRQFRRHEAVKFV
jgi:hypothetical protein